MSSTTLMTDAEAPDDGAAAAADGTRRPSRRGSPHRISPRRSGVDRSCQAVIRFRPDSRQAEAGEHEPLTVRPTTPTARAAFRSIPSRGSMPTGATNHEPGRNHDDERDDNQDRNSVDRPGKPGKNRRREGLTASGPRKPPLVEQKRDATEAPEEAGATRNDGTPPCASSRRANTADRVPAARRQADLPESRGTLSARRSACPRPTERSRRRGDDADEDDDRLSDREHDVSPNSCRAPEGCHPGRTGRGVTLRRR